MFTTVVFVVLGLFASKSWIVSASSSCHPPCEHGGSCVGGVYCECFNGYSGDHCQNFEYGTCFPYCVNGGTCNIFGSCDCPVGYSGSYCQHSATCNPSCENGGTCSYGSCDCTTEYYGSYCQFKYTSSDICTPSCENGGTCSYGSCDCTTEYYGSYCQFEYTSSDTCTPSCENGGTCSYGSCDCTTEYYGSYCQFEYTSSGVSSTPGIIVGSVIAGIFFFGCTFCLLFLRIWLTVRMATRQLSTPSAIPVTGRRVLVITQRTNTVKSNQIKFPNPNTGPPPPYSGPSPPYSGPVEPIIPDKDEDDDGDDVPLLSGN